MSTTRYEPTPAWTHALEEPTCLRHLLLVVIDKHDVVGWCRTFPASCQVDSTEASLGIGLLLEYRNRGIGSQLVQQSLIWAAGRGLQRVTLTTRLDNNRAIHIFTCCGFAFTGQTRDDTAEMACDLPVALG